MRIIAMLVVGVVACEVPETDIEQEAKTPSCVLDANKWQGQLIWPVSSLDLGTVSYTDAQARSILASSIRGNGLVDLAQQLIGAKLNYAMGASARDFVSAIAAADALIGSRVVPPVGTGFLDPSLTNALASKLGAFNKGSKNAGPCVGPQADVALEKTVSNTTPNVGDTITFTITVTDNGPVTATGVTVSDPLPPGLQFLSSNPSQGNYVASSGAWTIGTVATGTPETLLITAMVVSPDAQTNTATISHSDQFDPNLANNSSSVTVTPQQADLSITETVTNATPNVGDAITFTITLRDLGPDPATGVKVQDLLPVGLTLISSNPSQGSYASGTWTVGTLINGAQATLALQARVVSPSSQTNTATVSSSDQFDPDTTNNTATATATPQQADVSIVVSVDTATPPVGTNVSFQLGVTNLGPDAVTNLTVQDMLPAGVTFVSATLSQGSYGDITGKWTIGTLANASFATLVIVATVTSAGAITDTATISASDQFDPDTTNNSASATIN
jgi:uncharacterized repeat protein (TIGR01451 family)